MGLGDRIAEWVETTTEGWKDTLRGWVAHSLMDGVNEFLGGNEPESIDIVRDNLDKIKNDPSTPPEIKAMIEKLTAGTQPIPVLVLVLLAPLFIIPLITGISQPIGRLLTYTQDNLLATFRLDPLSVMTAWRRDPEKYAFLFKDLDDLGWSEERIEALKFFTEFLPNADEQTLWLAREVYEPEMVQKYGLDSELPDYANTDFSKVGVSPEQMTNKWRAHWQHASWIQVVEMLHRGLITEADVYEWFKLVEIPPYWRQLLIDTAYTWPTRVDVRRWWEMRTISEARLRELYAGMGYQGENLDDYITWTKVYTEFPSLLSRWSKGWITLDDVRSSLVALGMPADRVEIFIQEKIESESPERTAAEKDITKTDIYKGVKQERITRVEGMELLQELGYDEDEADYLLAINIPQDEVISVVNDRELSKSDIIAGLKAGAITEAEARDRLLGLRYTSIDAGLLLTIFQASIKPPAEPRQREASKADVVKAVKLGLITPGEGYLMLIDIGFTPEAADFVLSLVPESSPFSPVTFGEFKDLTGKWRRANKMTSPEFNEKLKAASLELVVITDQVKALEEAVKAETFRLKDQDVIPDQLGQRLKDLTISLNRAKAERQRLQQSYNALVAEFRQTPA